MKINDERMCSYLLNRFCFIFFGFPEITYPRRPSPRKISISTKSKTQYLRTISTKSSFAGQVAACPTVECVSEADISPDFVENEKKIEAQATRPRKHCWKPRSPRRNFAKFLSSERCRSVQILYRPQNEFVVAKIGFDPAEDGLSRVSRKTEGPLWRVSAGVQRRPRTSRASRTTSWRRSCRAGWPSS